MRHSLFMLALIVTGLTAHTAEASFRSEPPRSLSLIRGDHTAREGLQLARPSWVRALAQAATDPIPPPPLLEAPGGEVTPAPQEPQTAPPPPPSMRDRHDQPPEDDYLQRPVDPYANGVNFSEVMVGALFVIGVDVVSVAVVLGVILGLRASDPVTVLVAAVLTVIVIGVVQLVVSPLAAAMGAYWMSPEEGTNGFLGAVAGAYVAQLGVGVLAVAGYLAVLALGAQGGSAASVASLLFTVGGALVKWVGLPLGASLGIHWGTARGLPSGGVAQLRGQGPALQPHPRRPAPLATTPNERFSEATPTHVYKAVLARF